jgi:nucleotide-binding universal stress UspA family protein
MAKPRTRRRAAHARAAEEFIRGHRARAVRRILVPTDFSPGSDDALAHARELARGLGAEVLVLHVSAAMGSLPGSALARRERRAAERRLDAAVAALRATGVRADRRVRGGMPAEQILRAAATGGADLIVMGTHGRRGVARLLLGSVAEEVASRARCPVLTVHPEERRAR